MSAGLETSLDPLTLPIGIGRAIVESAALLACPLLGTDNFVRFCNDRDLSIDRERLIRFERLGLFAPVFRVRTPDAKDAESFNIPMRDDNNWFDKGWAWDTTAIPVCHKIPGFDDRTQEGYYSIFQVDHLRIALSLMTLHVHLDAYLEQQGTSKQRLDFRVQGGLKHANTMADVFTHHQYRPSVALLCQYISNRYYPKTQGDQRTIRVTSGGGSWDGWISINGHQWDWHEEARAWDTKNVESLFALTPVKLQHAYETLALSQSFLDPLQRWSELIQFVSIDQRKRLKGEALQAETLREGALMLRLLYKDLYREELPPPHEVHGVVITHMPEQNVRKDVRRHLEFVVNRYGLNPQPKLVLIVEGQADERAVNRLFEEVFGFAPGTCGIELLVIRGVDNATGGNREDRFRAILRLIDYLHHHQTLVYLLLDNENHAGKLKKASKEMRSIHGHRKRITRPEYIHIWKASFEFDNFSDTEIASAMSSIALGKHEFTRKEVADCRRSQTPGAELGRYYRGATGHDLPKVKLADALVDRLLSDRARKAVRNRAIIRALQRVVTLAVKNPLPVMQEIWEKNQASKILAKKQ